MSTSPLPPDPYEALGVSKDVDSDGVKKAHRKLVLKHHPDRIKDPALVEQGKNEFQKVQQAYELLIDPVKRQRYDDQVRLAQLRKERMVNERMSEREPPPRPAMYTRTTYSAPRPSPAPAHPSQREMKPEPRYAFEERAPESYFDPRYEEPAPRTSARKDPYEKRPSVSKPTEKRKDEKKASAWDRPAVGISLNMAFGLKQKAQAVKQKGTQKETHAKNAKVRDKEERRERSEKHTYGRYTGPSVEDYSSESSDSDTVVATPRRGGDPRARSPRPTPRSYSPEPMSRARSPRPTAPRTHSPEPIIRPRSPRPTTARERSPQPRTKPQSNADPQRRRQHSPQPSSANYESDSEDEWKRRLHFADQYINKARSEGPKAATRPPLSRQGSESLYWAADAARDHRKSGSDSDKTRPASSHKNPRRTGPAESGEAGRRPPLHHGASAPAGVKAAARTLEREPPMPRSRQGSYDARATNHRAGLFTDVPPLQRTSSDPVSPRMNTGTKRDSAPVKGSTLKESQTHQHDSGYGSSSTPHTPEMGSDSPPRPRETTTKFKVRKDEDEVHRARKMTDDGGDVRKFLSPESAELPYHGKEEKRERRSSRSRDPEPRKKSPDGRRHSPEPTRARSSKPGVSEKRPSYNRAESSTRYEEQRPRKVAMERSPERSSFQRVDPKSVKYASHAKPIFASHDGSRHTEAAFHRALPRERNKIPGY